MRFTLNKWTRFLTFFMLLSSAGSLQAGFLEMPDTTEVPEMERESMLKDLDIPSVRERDPDPMAGPRLNVTEFRVQGIVEFPKLGITRESLNKLVESIRFDMMGEGEMLESGYTLDEVSEISDLIAEIEEDTKGDSVGPLELQRLVFLIRDQRRRRGVTLGMIETVADTITRYYRERGFFLAKAYIPEQRVRDGVVTLTLLLGNLGEVEVLNNKKYTKKTIQRVLAPIVNEPVYSKNIEERLYFINDMPGMNAQAYFEPGKQVGDTKLNVNVVKERSYRGNIRFDNHGSDSTGEYRTYADAYWFNPTGLGDQLHVGILGTMSPANSTYGSLHYGLPLFSPRAKFTIGGSTNDFVSDAINQFPISGKSTVTDFSLNYILKRSRVKNYSIELRGARIKTDIALNKDPDSNQEPDDRDTDVTNFDLVFNFDVLNERWRALHQGGARITTLKLNELGKNVLYEDGAFIFASNYSLLKFIKVPFTDSDSRLVINTSFQYADKNLPSTSQFATSGPNRMRSLEINHYSSDIGGHIGVDWLFNAPGFIGGTIAGQKVKEMLQPYVFLDVAAGKNYDTANPPIEEGRPVIYNGKNKFQALGVGFGLKASFKNNFQAGLTYGKVLSYKLKGSNVTNDASGEAGLDSLDETEAFYLNMQYSF